MIEDAEATYNKWRHPDPYIGKLVTEFLVLTLLSESQYVGGCSSVSFMRICCHREFYTSSLYQNY